MELKETALAARMQLLQSKMVPLLVKRCQTLQTDTMDLLLDYAKERKLWYWHKRLSVKLWQSNSTRAVWTGWRSHLVEQCEDRSIAENADQIWAAAESRKALMHWQQFSESKPEAVTGLSELRLMGIACWVEGARKAGWEAWVSWQQQRVQQQHGKLFWERGEKLCVLAALQQYSNELARREMQLMQVLALHVFVCLFVCASESSWWQIVLTCTRFSLLRRMQWWQQVAAESVTTECQQLDAILQWTVGALRSAVSTLRRYAHTSNKRRSILHGAMSRWLTNAQILMNLRQRNTWAVVHHTYSALTIALHQWRTILVKL